MNRREFLRGAPVLPIVGVVAVAAVANEIAPPQKATMPFRFEAPDGNFMEISYNEDTRAFAFKTGDTYRAEREIPSVRDMSMMQFTPPRLDPLNLYYDGKPRYQFS